MVTENWFESSYRLKNFPRKLSERKGLKMGRYYNGDIEGKFWFAVQSSDDADYFGVQGEARFLNYYFMTEDLPKIEAGIKKCKKYLGSLLEDTR